MLNYKGVKMNKLLLVLLLFAVSISILIIGCSSDINITSPPLSNYNVKNVLHKTISQTLASSDTVIFLPKSKKTVIVSKLLKPQMISSLDNYMNKNVPANKAPISPMESMCSLYTQYGVEIEDQYKPLGNKTLGINLSTNVVSYDNARSYGFAKILVSDASSIANANYSGFSFANMMYQLSPGTTQSTISNLLTQGISSFFIDEPYEYNGLVAGWTTPLLNNMAHFTNPKPLFVSAYHWPEFSTPCNPFYYGTSYSGFIDAFSNTYIMCDEYHGNCCGTVDQYWSEFNSYYGVGKNPSNWLQLTANNGNGNTHLDCFYKNSVSNNWHDLLYHANYSGSGMNEIWLYANNTGSEQDVKNFVDTAWRLGWLSRYGRGYIIIWQCTYHQYDSTPNQGPNSLNKSTNSTSSDPCTQCNFNQEIGHWTPIQSWYTGDTYWYTYNNWMGY